MKQEPDYSDWVHRLHTIAEEFRQRDSKNTLFYRLARKFGYYRKRPEDQCALRWSANIVAEKRMREMESKK